MTVFHPGPKINLGLKILGLRSDGYHELQSILIPLPGPCDLLEIEGGNSQGLELLCASPDIDGENILFKTYRLFSAEFGVNVPLYIRLRKNIPTGAGLGGGSSDAACLLKYLACTLSDPPGQDELVRLGMKIGADVPFFLGGAPAVACGAGEMLYPLDPCIFKGLNVVLVWPDIHVSTAWAFQAYDRMSGLSTDFSGNTHGARENSLTKLLSGDTQFFLKEDHELSTLLTALENDLEPPVFAKYPLLAELGHYFRSSGAIYSGMSGSGSSIYGIFTDRDSARKAHSALRSRHKRVYHLSL